MTEDDRRIQALVAAVADGLPVDWVLAESGARSDEERMLVRQLRVLASVSSVHRSVDETLRDGSPGSTTAADAGEAPARWGPLELRELVGTGSYGAVYRAWDPRLDREVALKLLGNAPTGGAFADAVLAEARRLARIRHPNVIVVYGADVHDGRAGFWMELLEGQTLKQWLDAHGPMSSREATLAAIDVARALAAVHAAGLVHRDVKAQNVMREAGGRTVLMDFGAGVERGAASGLAGTPLYLAPELLTGQSATPASDVYSVGVLLYHLVSARFPVMGLSLDAIREAHAQGKRTTLRDVLPDLPATFVKVVERALAPDPATRPASAGQLETELAASLELPPDLPAPDEAAPAGRHATRRTLLMTSLGASALIVGLWLGGAFTRVASYVWPQPAVRSLAVLPLENLGGPDEAYFADGMTDLLTTNLSKLKPLRVISKSSVVGSGHAVRPLKELAASLGVDAVVRGSVLRDGNRLRVTAQLVSTRDGSSLWAETYERNVRDAFALQSDLARDIARGINLTLTPQEQQHMLSAGPASPEAQDEFLKGYSAMAHVTQPGVAEAIEHFEKATQLDPNYARAYSSLAYAYTWVPQVGNESQERTWSKARAAALKALELDDSQPAAHYVLGVLQFEHDWDWLGAQASFERALELDPNDPDAHTQYGSYLAACGRLPEALDHMQQARLLDPLQYSRHSSLAMVLYYMRRYDEAVAELQAILEADPNLSVAHFGLGRVYAATGRTTDALAELQASAPQAPFRARAEMARVLARAGRADEARHMLDDLEAESGRASGQVSWDMLGHVYAALGQQDHAFDLLERAASERVPTMLWIKVDPRYDTLRSDARYARLVAEIGVP